MSQQSLDLLNPNSPKAFRLYLNSCFVMESDDAEKIWTCIGQASLGTCYLVRKADGTVAAEFVPF